MTSNNREKRRGKKDPNQEVYWLSDQFPNEANALNAGQAETTQEIKMILERIIKLSHKADDPGMAYRNLDTINALANQLAKRLPL